MKVTCLTTTFRYPIVTDSINTIYNIRNIQDSLFNNLRLALKLH